jgi:HK97 family phage major capsid protein
MFGTEFRSVLTSTSTNTFTTVQRMDDLWPTLAAESVFLSTGPQRFVTDSTQFQIPAGTAFATASWKAEGGTASATDAGYKLVTITPDVLMTVSEFSTEAAEDNPYLLDAAAGEIFRKFGRSIDAAFLDAGNSSHISALHGNAGAGTAAAGGAITDLDPFVAAAGSALAQGVPYSNLVYVVGPSTWQALGTAHIGATEDVRPLLTTSANAGGGAAIADNRLLGRPMFVSSDLSTSGGTAYALCYDPNQVAVVTRREFTVLVDPVTKADAGITRIVASLRIGGAAVNSKAVAEIGGIVP